MPESSPAAPAPMSVCSSSMKRMIRGSAITSSITCLRRSSNSPRYLVSATSIPTCRERSRLPCSRGGTFLSTIICASPSARAVLPTPGSPTRQGLHLRRLTRMRSMRPTSSSRPTQGSSLPSRAMAVRSTEHSASTDFFLEGPRTALPAPTRSFFSSSGRLRSSSSRAPASLPRAEITACPAQRWSPAMAAAMSRVVMVSSGAWNPAA
mmetsp:Transcript_45742/g.145765  ORF Transcript_45742/g.145765 Transcript_45742/m.145765 type:complete len:208 (+) Transcript_45742:1581-2204(+)